MERVERRESPSERELREFEKDRILLDAPERPFKVDLDRIDPTTFNIVDHYLKVPTFKLCTKIIPTTRSRRTSSTSARDSRATFPGRTRSRTASRSSTCVTAATRARTRCGRSSPTITATAAKGLQLRDSDPNRLAVKAGKWGGCCVTWWYHVAPLVRVRIKIKLLSFNLDFVLAMVIDPGMFDKPVLLSTWLAAQEDIDLLRPRQGHEYSIQPGSAYTPANGSGTGSRPTRTTPRRTIPDRLQEPDHLPVI